MQAVERHLPRLDRRPGIDGRRARLLRAAVCATGRGRCRSSDIDPERHVGSTARMCGWTLARAHARSGDRVAIASYLGKGDRFDKAIADVRQRLRRPERTGLHDADHRRDPEPADRGEASHVIAATHAQARRDEREHASAPRRDPSTLLAMAAAVTSPWRTGRRAADPWLQRRPCAPAPRANLAALSSMMYALSMIPTCENACGKLPSWRCSPGWYSSASSPSRWSSDAALEQRPRRRRCARHRVVVGEPEAADEERRFVARAGRRRRSRSRSGARSRPRSGPSRSRRRSTACADRRRAESPCAGSRARSRRARPSRTTG